MYRFRLAIELRFFSDLKSLIKLKLGKIPSFYVFFFSPQLIILLHDTKSKRHQFKWQENKNENYFEIKPLCTGLTLAQTGRDLNILIGIREKSYD